MHVAPAPNEGLPGGSKEAMTLPVHWPSIHDVAVCVACMSHPASLLRLLLSRSRNSQTAGRLQAANHPCHRKDRKGHCRLLQCDLLEKTWLLLLLLSLRCLLATLAPTNNWVHQLRVALFFRLVTWLQCLCSTLSGARKKVRRQHSFLHSFCPGKRSPAFSMVSDFGMHMRQIFAVSKALCILMQAKAVGWQLPLVLPAIAGRSLVASHEEARGSRCHVSPSTSALWLWLSLHCLHIP